MWNVLNWLQIGLNDDRKFQRNCFGLCDSESSTWERLQSCKGRFLWTDCTVQARSVAREQSHTDLHCCQHINTHKYYRDSTISSHSLLAMHRALCKPYCRKQFPDPSSYILVYFLSPWISSRWIIKLCKNNFSSVQYFVSKCSESKFEDVKTCYRNETLKKPFLSPPTSTARLITFTDPNTMPGYHTKAIPHSLPIISKLSP